MILAGSIIAALVLVWIVLAAVLASTQRISFRQAILLVPLHVLWGVDGTALRNAHAHRSVVYVVSHQSRLDAALMLSLLPDDTLHILDAYSANAAWMEPWRTLSRTSAFNPEHIFVNRRLVRILRGGGRLCVYLPADLDPETRAFRLYRAVARIADRAGAKVVPVHIEGAGSLPFAFRRAAGVRSRLLARLQVRALEPATSEELIARYPNQSTRSGALYERMGETRLGGAQD